MQFTILLIALLALIAVADPQTACTPEEASGIANAALPTDLAELDPTGVSLARRAPKISCVPVPFTPISSYSNATTGILLPGGNSTGANGTTFGGGNNTKGVGTGGTSSSGVLYVSGISFAGVILLALA